MKTYLNSALITATTLLNAAFTLAQQSNNQTNSPTQSQSQAASSSDFQGDIDKTGLIITGVFFTVAGYATYKLIKSFANLVDNTQHPMLSKYAQDNNVELGHVSTEKLINVNDGNNSRRSEI